MATVLSPESTGFITAHRREEALDSLAELGDDATILAGGTDVMAQLLRAEIAPPWLLHIGRVDDFGAYELNDGRVTLPPLVSHRTISTTPSLSSALPALAEACSTVGGWQTQVVGTVVGNVCNASPAADAVPPLLIAETIVHLESATEKRSLPLADFITGRRATASRPDEMVVGLELEPVARGTGEAYLKVAPRSAMEVAVVGLAVRLRFEDGRLSSARVAPGAVAPVPFRAIEAEALLVDSGLSTEGIQEAATLLADQASPIDDARASSNYRRKVLGRLLGRAVEVARHRAGED